MCSRLAGFGCSGGRAPDGGSGSGGASGGGSDEPGRDTLVVAMQADAETFVSVVNQSATNSWLIDNMFLGLTTSDFDCRIIYKPALAKSWDHAEDGLSITYHMLPLIQKNSTTNMPARG